MLNGKFDEVMARNQPAGKNPRAPTERELSDACHQEEWLTEPTMGCARKYRAYWNFFYKDRDRRFKSKWNIKAEFWSDAKAYAPPSPVEEQTYMQEEDVRFRYNLHMLSQPAHAHQGLLDLHERLSK